jgi:hypothetical protein
MMAPVVGINRDSSAQGGDSTFMIARLVTDQAERRPGLARRGIQPACLGCMVQRPRQQLLVTTSSRSCRFEMERERIARPR